MEREILLRATYNRNVNNNVNVFYIKLNFTILHIDKFARWSTPSCDEIIER